jgi:membrane-associated phospholipid phosphatase
MLEAIIHIDQIIFHAINIGQKNFIFDFLMPIFRNPLTWIPLYVLLLVISYQKYGKKTIYIILLLSISVFVTDQISSQVVKKTIKRLRPCNDVSLYPASQNIISCGTGFSFPSSHAANHTCVAILFGSLLFDSKKRLKRLLLAWAISIGYAQIYVGVHYPFDVLGGICLGILTSNIGLFLFRKMVIS